MQRLRGDAREPAAYQLVAEALKNEGYRESFSREMLRLPQSLTLADADSFALGENRRRAVEATDAVHVKAVERRSDDLQHVPVNGLGSSVARDPVRLDLDALRATEQPWQRLTIAERMAANANVQAAYKAEVVRQDPEIARSIEQFQRAGRSVHVIVANDRPHITGAAACRSAGVRRLGAAPSRAGNVRVRAAEPAHARADFRGDLRANADPRGEPRLGQQAVHHSSGVRFGGRLQVELPRPRRRIGAQPGHVARGRSDCALHQGAAAGAGSCGSASTDTRSRATCKRDRAAFARTAVRRRWHGCTAQAHRPIQRGRTERSCKLDAGDRTLETLSRMTRKELEAFEQAIKRSPDQVQTVLAAAQKRIEGDVELRVGRDPVPPLHERYNIIAHLASRDYLFRDKPGTAFTEGWLTLKSAHDTADVIKAMLDRADQRGWTAVNVNGSPEFKRQAWICCNRSRHPGRRAHADRWRSSRGGQRAQAPWPRASTGSSANRGEHHARPEARVRGGTGIRNCANPHSRRPARARPPGDGTDAFRRIFA